MQEPRGRKSIAPTHSWPRHLIWVSGQRHVPAAFTPGERSPDTHWIGGWVGFSAGLDTEARGKRLFLCRGSNPGRPVCSQTPCWLSYTPQTLLGGWGGQGLSRKREVINGYNMSVGNRDGKRRHGKRKRRWTGDTIMGLNRMRIAGIGCSRSTLYRGVSCQLSICVCVHWLGSCMAGELGERITLKWMLEIGVSEYEPDAPGWHLVQRRPPWTQDWVFRLRKNRGVSWPSELRPCHILNAGRWTKTRNCFCGNSRRSSSVLWHCVSIALQGDIYISKVLTVPILRVDEEGSSLSRNVNVYLKYCTAPQFLMFPLLHVWLCSKA
jgi:hypothetical protein